MIIKNVNLETVCGITSTLPTHEIPEFAFAGKSNVGKSSMINCLMNRKSYARTSQNPGKTQTVNYYNINNSQMYFVDLPGYGYAKVSKEEKAKWGVMIENYLHGSPSLKAIFLLVDCRHEPSGNDKDIYNWIVHNGFEPIIIATKADKLKRSQYQKAASVIRKGLGLKPGNKLILFSSENRMGRDELYDMIDELLLEPAEESPVTEE